MRTAVIDEDPTALPTLELDELALARQRQQLMHALFGLEPTPRHLEHYELLRELGRGAMGVVYAAHDHRLDREVALKTLANTGDPELRRRLVIEAQAMAKLAHPNVVPIHEIGEAEGTIFIVMDRVEGVSLRMWLEQRTRSPAQILEVFVAAGRGLAAAHAKGIVHRDFKPDNVMVGDDGRVQVMDFGVARSSGRVEQPGSAASAPELSETQWALTRAGALVGTPAYMAPEQMRGGAADRASDQFSFCVALYEALYGVRPFPGADLSELRAALERAQLHFPPEVAVPAWLRTLLAHGLAAEPNARFPSMDALLEALTQGEAAHEPPELLYIAHARGDALALLGLGEQLLREGLRCWLELWEGASERRASEALLDAPALLLCCGPRGWPLHLQAAIETRLARDPSSVWTLRLAPSYDAELPSGWPAPLVAAGPNIEQQDPALRALVSNLGPAPSPARWLAEEAARMGCAPELLSPYRGLQPFGPSDARWMFGREAQIAELCARLLSPDARRFLCVVGASGSGKSSLVRAGLGPALRAGVPDPKQAWAIASLRPGAQPCEALGRALAELGGMTSAAPAYAPFIAECAASVRDYPRNIGPLLLALARIRADAGLPRVRMLLVIDQLEELFTLAKLGRDGGGQAASFVEALVRATRDPRLGLWVVATLRADFIPRCLEQRTLARVLHAGTYLALPPMAKAQIRAAVELPALRVGHALEPALVAELVTATAEQPGRLPLLQHLLRELWQRRDRDARTLRLRDYMAAGGLEGALAGAANAALEALRSELGAGTDACVRRVMTRLVQTSARAEADTRRRATRAELGEDPDTARVLARFVDEARVLVASREGGVEVFELAHEALLREWTLLREWLDADREALALRESLGEAARVYAAHEDPEYLWGKGRVEEAERVLAASTVTLVASEQDFLARCRRRAREREQLVWAAVAALILVLLTFSAVTASLALEYRRELDAKQRLAAAEQQQRSRADTGLSAQRGLQASLLARGHMDLQPLLLAIEALGAGTGSSPTVAAPPEAYRGILDALAMEAVLGPVALLDAHTRALSDLALSPDGSRLATASLDGSAHIWDARSGELLARLDDHAGPVSALAFSPDGSRLATASWDQRARMWDSATGRLLTTLAGHDGELRALAFSPDGSRLATASADSSARIWSLAEGPEPRALSVLELRGHGAELSAIAFSPQGTRLITTSLDASARLWDADSGAPLHTLGAHASRVLGAHFAPDGASVITYGYEPTARLWSVESGEQLQAFEGHRSSVTAAAFAPDGHSLATASFDDSARLWDLRSGELLTRFEGHSDDVVDLAFVGRGATQQLLTASADASARLWKLESGASLAVARGHSEAIVALAAVPLDTKQGLRFATASADASARLWSLDTAPLPPRTLGARGPTVHALAHTPEGALASASADGTVRLWDPSTGHQRHTLSGHVGEVLALALSPDGSRLASAGADTTVRLWALESGQPLALFEGHQSHVVALEFSPDGQALASASLDGTAKLWGTRSHEQLASFTRHRSQVVALAFSPDGQRLATASYDGSARIWDIPLDAPLALLEGHKARVVALEFSPDGSRLATASHDRGVHLWDGHKGTLLARLAGHEDAVVALAFSPDGSRLASASADGSARLWSPEGELLHVLRGHGAPLVTLAWSPDATLLATAGLDDSVRLWDPQSGQLRGLMSSPGDPTDLAFSPDGSALVSATTSGLIAQWPTPPAALRLACTRAAPFLELAAARVASICAAALP